MMISDRYSPLHCHDINDDPLYNNDSDCSEPDQNVEAVVRSTMPKLVPLESDEDGVSEDEEGSEEESEDDENTVVNRNQSYGYKPNLPYKERKLNVLYKPDSSYFNVQRNHIEACLDADEYVKKEREEPKLNVVRTRPKFTSEVASEGKVFSSVDLESLKMLELYECYNCDFDTTKRSDFIEHLKIHPNQTKRYSCSVCGYRTAWKFSLSRHMLSKHSEERPFKCVLCDYSCKVKQTLTGHMRKHSNAKLFSCSICHVKLRDRDSVNRHIKAIHQGITRPKNFKCESCDYRAVSRSQITVHQRVHTGERPFACKECDFTTAIPGSLKYHIVAKHTVRDRFKCEHCKFQTLNKYEATRHEKYHSGELTYFNCDQCEHRSLSKKMGYHKKYHNHDAEWKCESCEFSVPTKRVLIKHIVNDHSDKLPHKCGICGYRTGEYYDSKQAGNMRVHMLTHVVKSEGRYSRAEAEDEAEKEMKYSCAGCSFKADMYPVLVRHLKHTHTEVASA